jgi:dihydroflavonol-4-reductase
VRDVALAQVRALRAEGAVGERFIVAGHHQSYAELAKVLAEAFPRARIPTRRLPDWVVRLVSLFDSEVRLVVPFLGAQTHFDSAKATRVLGFQPRPLRETVLDSATSLQQHGLAPTPS